MGKPIQSSSGIEKRSPTQSLTPSQERAALIGEYLYKFATIANREMPQDGELTKIFSEALSDLDEKSLRRGFEAYLREGDRFPWPADIRTLGEL